VSVNAYKGNGSWKYWWTDPWVQFAEDGHRPIFERAVILGGKVCEQDGTAGVCKDPKVFENYCTGFSPDGAEKRAENAGSPVRVNYYGLTVNHPKPVSVFLTTLPGEEDKGKLLERLKEDVKKAVIARIEDSLSQRSTKKEIPGHQADIGYAIIVDIDARTPGDVHLHADIIILAPGRSRIDGKFRTIDPLPLFKMQRELTAIHNVCVANTLAEHYGVVCKRTHFSFDLGVKPDQKENWEKLKQSHSTASEKIKDNLKDESNDPRAKAAEARKDRPKKQHMTDQERQRLWDEKAKAFGISAESFKRTTFEYLEDERAAKAADKAAKKALRYLKRQTDVITPQQIREMTLVYGIGKHLRETALVAAAERIIANPHKHKLSPITYRGEPAFHPEWVEKIQQKLTRIIDRIQEQSEQHELPYHLLLKAAILAGPMSHEQKAVVTALTQGNIAVAGDLKTESLTVKTTVAAYREAGYRTLAVACDRPRTAKLGNELGTDQMTVSEFVRRAGRTSHWEVFKEVRRGKYASVNEMLKAAEHIRKPEKILDDRTVLVLDPRDVRPSVMLAVAEVVARTKAKLVLVNATQEQKRTHEQELSRER
jgi:hypothetical protein